MKIAVDQLVFSPDYVLVDGTKIPELKIPHEKIIKGDSKCFYIISPINLIFNQIYSAVPKTYPKQARQLVNTRLFLYH